MSITIGGRPTVLAFVRSWDPTRLGPNELARMRAELRGLGAELHVHAETGAWWLSADDEIAALSGDPPVLGRDRDRDDDAVFVLDEAGCVRFSHVNDGPMTTTLTAALTAAGQALVAVPQPRLLFNRREWVMTSLCAGMALALLGCRNKRREDPAPAPHPAPPPMPAEYDIVLDVNGKEHPLKVEARVSVLDALRERLGLTGTKKGCDHGQCGACTIHMDGRRVLACMVLAVVADRKKLTTIEGLANGDTLHPVQRAFVEHDGFQCGYCTPGQIMSAVALLAEGKATTDDEVREHMSGNLCRCGAYPNIVAAIQAARKGA